jgi:aminoglycoside phosphotransferase (APT) family kinase protein
MSDRAQSILWDHAAFNTLPGHVRSLDVGAFKTDGQAVSLGDAEEFFTLTEYGEGEPYANDLERILGSGDLQHTDLARADALCDYLVEIHSVKNTNDDLYVRRIRELVGHSECIMGLIDSYPVSDDKLFAIEKQCIEWRWKLKSRVHRLRQVHGDFHPWNILFRREAEFCLLDRSRGEWGDPADDVTCLTMNYVFFSLQQHGRLSGSFEKLFLRFWDRYLERSADREILQVAAPFLVFRGLVLAHPVWYPGLSEQIRGKLFRFMSAVLEAEFFDPGKVNDYCNA